MNSALLFIAAAALLALGVGFLARRGKHMDLEQWTLGGRGFGALFVFLLMTGETRPAAVQDINVGIIALALNFAVLILVSLVTRLAAAGALAISARARHTQHCTATGSSSTAA